LTLLRTLSTLLLEKVPLNLDFIQLKILELIDFLLQAGKPVDLLFEDMNQSIFLSLVKFAILVVQEHS